ncbi:MAG: long-chain fatty acid--CoA ligase [Bacteroidales bacterium]|nr:long-chain fatty acid--CoA ligase [Bacteroidales bacterium]
MNKFRLFDILDFSIQKFSHKNDILAGKEGKEWVKYSAREYKRKSEEVAIGLLELGVKKGDKIATISNNRPEWNFVDMASSMIGMIHTPIYPTLTEEDFEYILKHSEATILIVSDKLLYNKLSPLISKAKKLKHFFTFNVIDGAKNWSEIVDLGQKNYTKKIDELNKIKATIKPDDLATLIYTSGTTNNPKGVMLTHWNFVYQIHKFVDLIDINDSHSALSFLPLCHVLERIVNYTYQYLGTGVYYAEGFHKLAENMAEVRPHIFTTVPRVIERFYDKIISKGEALEGIKKKIFFAALKHAEKYKIEGNSIFYKAQLSIYDNLVFSQWRKAFGSRIKYIISGGAALSPRLSRIFWAAGIPVREGYGLTETAPVITFTGMPPEGVKLGSVGKKIGTDQDLVIAKDGEILFRGPNLMQGYYKAPELTAEAIDDEGWFHTGDLGSIDDRGFLNITGRKKEIFKLSNGKYISPAIIENIFIESHLIEQMMVVGENEKFAGALISPNFETLEHFAKENQINYTDNKDLITQKPIIDLIKKEVISLNKKLAQYERITTFKVVCEEWSPATGELSATLKKKRHVIDAKYRFLIEEMFSAK